MAFISGLSLSIGIGLTALCSRVGGGDTVAGDYTSADYSAADYSVV